MDSPDERLRAATIALAEHDNFLHAFDVLRADMATEERRVQELSIDLARERRDVEQLTQGVLGFLASLAMTSEVEREQREAMEAEVRLREAVASRDSLRTQLSTIQARIQQATRAGLEAEVRAARAALETSVIQSGGPRGAELQDLAIRIESIDIELVPLEDAVMAGSAAVGGLSQILVLLDRAAASPERGGDHVNEARGLIGDTQAKILMFQRAVDVLAVPDDRTPSYATAISDEDRRPFSDDWIRKLFAKGDRAARLADAHASMLDRYQRIQALLAPVRERRDQLAGRRNGLVITRDKLLVTA